MAGVQPGSTPACTIIASPSTTTSGWRASQCSSSSRSGAARIASSVSSRCARRCPAATVSRCRSWLPSTVVAAGAERADLAQHREGIGPAVDEVAHQPQPVGGRREADQVEELAELGMAALQVADRVVRHAVSPGRELRGGKFAARQDCTSRARMDRIVLDSTEDLAAPPHVVSAQRAAARGRALRRRPAARARRRRQRQDARHHRQARAPGRARRGPGAARGDHVHQQGGPGDAGARGEAARRAGPGRGREGGADLHLPLAGPRDPARRAQGPGPQAGLLDPRPRRPRADRCRARRHRGPREGARGAMEDQRLEECAGRTGGGAGGGEGCGRARRRAGLCRATPRRSRPTRRSTSTT